MNLNLIEETLTDGSKAYGVRIGEFGSHMDLDCRSLADAIKLMDRIARLTVNTVPRADVVTVEP